MKATLKFNLPEDQEDFEMANNAKKYYCALWDIKDAIRSMLKYSEPKEPELLEKLRDLIPYDLE